MPREAPIYDLVLLLSTTAPEERRVEILADVESAIAAGGGSIARRDQWGRRPMTYQIDHQSEAEYHLVGLAGPPALLDSLSRRLRVADGVLRFRIIKVLPGTPAPPEAAPPVIAAAVPAPALATADPSADISR